VTIEETWCQKFSALCGGRVPIAATGRRMLGAHVKIRGVSQPLVIVAEATEAEVKDAMQSGWGAILFRSVLLLGNE
jgi:hypothetical protein